MKNKLKNIAFATALFLAANFANAQVKIGTNPTTIGANSNLEVEATNANKVIITQDKGQILTGTTTVPTGGTNAKVIIDNGTTAGAVQIKDGTQGVDKVFSSDANGVGTWVQSKGTYISGNVPTTATIINSVADRTRYYTGCSLTLTPGRYIVYYSNSVEANYSSSPASYSYFNNFWFWYGFSTSDLTYTPLSTASYIANGDHFLQYTNLQATVLYGFLPIEITATTTLYSWMAVGQNVGFSGITQLRLQNSESYSFGNMPSFFYAVKI